MGRRGAEGGVVLDDEEHDAGARITIERDCLTAPFAITCGAYGRLMHTRFFEHEDDCRRDYQAMKADLANIAASPQTVEPADLLGAIDLFIERFP